MTDLAKYSGAGMETTEGISATMPFLQIIQSGSPEIKKTHEKHQERKVDGAEEGDIVFLPEKLLFKGEEGVEVIPLAFKYLYTEWRPKSSGGGFVGYQPLSVTTHPDYKKGSDRSQYDEFLGDNELISTIYVAVLFQHEGEWKRGVISFTSTQLRKARAWSKVINSFRYPENKAVAPPIFACTYRLKTEGARNDAGSWFGWNISTVGPITEEALLDEAHAAYQDAKAELPSAAEPKQLNTGTEQAGEEEPY